MTRRNAVTAAAPHALIGWPLAASLSPAMHNAAIASLGLDARYVLRPTPSGALDVVVSELRTGELAGANVTVPHKLAVRDLLEAESALVAATGAVNTIVRTDAGLRGENTDVAGFRYALDRTDATDGRGRGALVLGAGGGARAITYALAEAGYGVRVLSRRPAQSAVLVSQLNRTFPDVPLSNGPLNAKTLLSAADAYDLVVNTTPVGAEPDADASPWPDDAPVPDHLTVIDIVAWPPETGLVRQARAGGARAFGGLDMLIGQAAASFALWFDRPAPIDVMREAALSAARASDPTAGPSGTETAPTSGD